VTRPERTLFLVRAETRDLRLSFRDRHEALRTRSTCFASKSLMSDW
jgi:hypothetical protein